MQEGGLGGRDGLGRKEKAGVFGAVLSPEGGGSGGAGRGRLDRCAAMLWWPWLAPGGKLVCLGLREPRGASEGGPVVTFLERGPGTHAPGSEPGGGP